MGAMVYELVELGLPHPELQLQQAPRDGPGWTRIYGAFTRLFLELTEEQATHRPDMRRVCSELEAMGGIGASPSSSAACHPGRAADKAARRFNRDGEPAGQAEVREAKRARNQGNKECNRRKTHTYM